MIYPESRGDYFTKSWTPHEFKEQFEVAADLKAYVGVTEEGMMRLNIFGKIRELLKGIFGGTNRSTEQRVHAAWMKFLYYGEAQGALSQDQIDRLRSRINYTPLANTPVGQFFHEMQVFHNEPTKKSKSEHLESLRQRIIDFHQRNASALRPGLWSRLFTRPDLDPQKLFDFGDTPLQLSRNALDQKQPDPQLAFSYLQRAFELKNDSHRFQVKLAAHLKKLEDRKDPILKNQSKKFQEMWIELAQNAFKEQESKLAKTYLDRALLSDSKHAKGRLEVGRMFLDNKDYELAKPFLHELQTSQDPAFQTEIGHAYWNLKEFTQAIAAYETAIKYHSQSAIRQTPAAKKEIAALYRRIGNFYLGGADAEKRENLIKAKVYFSKAFPYDPDNTEVQDDLCKVYEKIWAADPDAFAVAEGQEFLNRVISLNSKMKNKWEAVLSKIFIHCTVQYFNAHQNQTAHTYLEVALQLFPERADLKIEALDLAIRYHDLAPLGERILRWNHDEYANPYLKKKIGDAYWADSGFETALEIYEGALKLFSIRLKSCGDKEKGECRKLMAEIQAKIGQWHLQTDQGGSQALKWCEEAAKLDPAHSPLYSQACLAVAEKEKERWLGKDIQKIIDFRLKAFEAHPKKEDSLVELLGLCFDAERHEDAINLYKKMKEQSWFAELDIPASLTSKLAKALKKKDPKEALVCFRAAHLKEPKKQEYKADYYKFNLKRAKQLSKKIQDSSTLKEEKRIDLLNKLIAPLKECWDKGFDSVANHTEPYQIFLTGIYQSIAKSYVRQYLIPPSAGISPYDREDIKEHREKYSDEMKIALKYWDQVLSINPKHAVSHFEKGLILDYWLINHAEAFKAYELAAQCEPKNPYYQWLLAQTNTLVHGKRERTEQHKKLAEEHGYENFSDDWKIFHAEMLFLEKTKEIDPHAYTKQKKGWYLFQ